MTPLSWAAVYLAYAGLEYWLGKTGQVKPGSVLEAAFVGLKLVAGVFLKGKSNGVDP